MSRENLYEPFSIAFETLNEGPQLAHEHTFFELVYILSGTGRQCINKHHFAYRTGHLFLLTPRDCHAFEVETTTEFFFLRFHDVYLRDQRLPAEQRNRLEFILQHANHEPGCILKHVSDKQLVKPMVEAILREYINRDLYNRELIQQLVHTLIVVVARNIALYLPECVSEATEEKVVDILQYIHQHIDVPEKIRAEAVSEHFGISESYLGRYFKKHTGETMQQYILTYKARLVETRLLHSDLRINEIAHELGFTDESHLNKFFRKVRGVSPSVFRRQRQHQV